jgi:hypothetical protein
MNEERILKVLNNKIKENIQDQDGNNRLGKMSHRRKEERTWKETEEEDKELWGTEID